MTNDLSVGNEHHVPLRGQDALGTSESLAHRLWLMIELTGVSADDDVAIMALSEKLRAAGSPCSPRTIRGHLDGSVVPAARELAAYGVACEWYQGSALLSDDPALYMKPLIQAEMFLCENFLAMPMARGNASSHGLDAMSTHELRTYRAELLATGRLAPVA